jgi:deferrochelatase/peroxidase EfeB
LRQDVFPSNPTYAPNEGLPGQDLIWPGEFLFGYPGQDPKNPVKAGPPPEMAASWMKNGLFMVFRRLEQKVPEFRKFVAAQAARLGMDAELLAARMVGRWKSGAPLELAPLRDNPALGADKNRNNNFTYSDDPFQLVMTRFNANTPMRRISARRTHATTRATRLKRSGIASSAPLSHSAPRSSEARRQLGTAAG